MVVEIEDSLVGSVRQVGISIKLSHMPGQIRSLGPTAGENNDEVLASIGYTSQQIREMRERGAVS
jgi:crotonobetainyl-CoA:carnitine CoA-transferase CaiB-like acyl-CoA transferase